MPRLENCEGNVRKSSDQEANPLAAELFSDHQSFGNGCGHHSDTRRHASDDDLAQALNTGLKQDLYAGTNGCDKPVILPRNTTVDTPVLNQVVDTTSGGTTQGYDRVSSSTDNFSPISNDWTRGNTNGAAEGQALFQLLQIVQAFEQQSCSDMRSMPDLTTGRFFTEPNLAVGDYHHGCCSDDNDVDIMINNVYINFDSDGHCHEQPSDSTGSNPPPPTDHCHPTAPPVDCPPAPTEHPPAPSEHPAPPVEQPAPPVEQPAPPPVEQPAPPAPEQPHTDDSPACTYTTKGGETVTVNHDTVVIQDKNGNQIERDWGDPHTEINGVNTDWDSTSRTITLPSGATVTMDAIAANRAIQHTTIHDGNDTVDIDNGSNTLTETIAPDVQTNPVSAPLAMAEQSPPVVPAGPPPEAIQAMEDAAQRRYMTI
jgi:hypothetical protein